MTDLIEKIVYKANHDISKRLTTYSLLQQLKDLLEDSVDVEKNIKEMAYASGKYGNPRA